ncbi:hypothetical protein EV360DRAFT_86151 [Lentinula raphanica]|nr:hypothetical protein EV360DRAFT_86151 [Lentinula raphanica]
MDSKLTQFLTEKNSANEPAKLTPSQLISPEGRRARLAAIEEGLLSAQSEHHTRVNVAEQVANIASTLVTKEHARVKLQADLDTVEDEIADAVNAASQTLQNLQFAFTPPSTPSRSHKLETPTKSFKLHTQPARPQSPSRSPTPTPRTPKVIPGGRFTMAALPNPDGGSPGGNAPTVAIIKETGPWYILYHGRDGAQGIFNSFDEVQKDGPSLRSLTQFYKHCIYKKFQSRAQAEMIYAELVESKVLNLLKPQPVKNEIFIVLKGVCPGVYTKRLDLLVRGLAWCGGEVMGSNGARKDALKVFEEWEAEGKTGVLAAKCSWP